MIAVLNTLLTSLSNIYPARLGKGITYLNGNKTDR